MRRFVSIASAALLMAGFAVADKSAHAAAQDGKWSVLVVTEQGACDRAYRYEVVVTAGTVRYEGDAPVEVAGTVNPAGVVKVSISGGGNVARGTGKLSAQNGAGTWRGSSSDGACAGRWEAARR